jgi:hypothetical protein
VLTRAATVPLARLTQREAADVLGVGATTVNRDVAVSSETPDDEPEEIDVLSDETRTLVVRVGPTVRPRDAREHDGGQDVTIHIESETDEQRIERCDHGGVGDGHAVRDEIRLRQPARVLAPLQMRRRD